MGIHTRSRVLLVIALVGGMLGATASSASADDDAGSNGVIPLDEKFEGWFSNGMVNDPEACGPFQSSEDAVVWHLFADVPDEVDEVDINDADVDFGGKVATEVRISVSDNRVDMWAG